MESFIAGILISLGIGIAKRWRHWSKVERAAEAIVNDTSNPISNPREAIEAAAKQAYIEANQRHIEIVTPRLGRRLAEAEARARMAQWAEAADPHDVTIHERDGTEAFQSPWSDGGKP